MSNAKLTDVLADRIDLLRELDAIEAALVEIEQQYGLMSEIHDVRQRQESARAVVLEQLSGLLNGNVTDATSLTVH